MKLGLCIAGAFATLWTLGVASAADLPRPIVKAPPPPLMYNWTGFYAGVNIGGGAGHQDTALTGVGTNSLNVDGVFGGGQVGYNWQAIGSPWVYGLEADIQGSGQYNNATFLASGTTVAYQDKLEWFGTVRGRIGYAAGDQGRWLPYITGGLAYGADNINGSGNVGATAVAFSQTKTNVGWTLGAGVEWAFADKWSAKFEYLHMDLGSAPTVAVTAANLLTTGHMSDDVARLGVNYHF